MKTLFDSLVRTFTPIVVGAVLAWFTTAGIALDPEFETALTLAVGGAFAGVYYLAVRLFELYVSPKFGWLLGLAKPPVYDATEPVLIPVGGPDRDEILTSLIDATPSEREASIQAAASRVNK
ncbi:hypothetical protein [Microbacterium sp. TPD7012]|uniref:hypothetical protein n=1 Tax=Microbacterium sp. TPD7012 TaxID=2171975 RepID=UPI000D517476|nr:hypothetical protein [Microbacterium sp. TPD7012]PVE94982.1 hypothetical protein DC434_13740 [Microbacterium sp. TPD7012]